MKLLDRGIRPKTAALAGVLAVLYAAPAAAQENLYGNKTPAQIFTTDCAICHKSPQGLSKAGGLLGLGLESFLREHYTASRDSAALLAKYIQAMDTGPAAPERGTKRAATGGGAKPAAKKGTEAKAGDGKPSDAKPSDSKPADAKTEAKPEPKVEAKPASESKPAEAAKPEKSE